MAQAVLSFSPDGRYTRLSFLTQVLAASLASTDADTRNAIQPLKEWWLAASTNDAAGACSIGLDQTAPGSPLDSQSLAARVNQTRDQYMAHLGHGGPGLSNAAFSAGVAQLQHTLNTNATDRLDFERARADVSFTDKHGAALSQRLHYLCGVSADEFLPEIHRVLAKAPRGHYYGLIAA